MASARTLPCPIFSAVCVGPDGVRARVPAADPHCCRVFEKDGARVVVDHSSLELLAGSTVDFEDEMMKSGFAVTANPKAEAGCGCGTSFSVEI